MTEIEPAEEILQRCENATTGIVSAVLGLAISVLLLVLINI